MSPIPSLALFDHTAKRWSPLELRGDLGGAERRFNEGTVFRCRVAAPGRAQGQQSGAGMSPGGEWKVYALVSDLAVLHDQDVIEVLTGNEALDQDGATRKLFVERAYEPRSIHGIIARMWQVTCRQYDGELTPVETS